MSAPAWVGLCALAAMVTACVGASPPATTEIPSPRETARGDLPVAPPPPQPEGSRYACDDGRVLHIKEEPASLTVDGLQPTPQVLLRDAGGVGPEETVWAAEGARVELGLGPDARGATVHVLGGAPLTLHCRRD